MEGLFHHAWCVDSGKASTEIHVKRENSWMSVLARRIIEIKMEKKYISFNLWHDKKLMDFLRYRGGLLQPANKRWHRHSRSISRSVGECRIQSRWIGTRHRHRCQPEEGHCLGKGTQSRVHPILLLLVRIKMKFPLGRIVWTRGVNDRVAVDAPFAKFVVGVPSSPCQLWLGWDWSAEDKQRNNDLSWIRNWDYCLRTYIWRRLQGLDYHWSRQVSYNDSVSRRILNLEAKTLLKVCILIH